MSAASVQFTEVLRGRMGAVGEAGAAGWPAAVRLTVTLDDVEGFLRGARRARAEGWVEPLAPGGRRPVTAGTVDFFVPGPPAAPTGRAPRLGLVYTLPSTSARGTPPTASCTAWPGAPAGCAAPEEPTGPARATAPVAVRRRLAGPAVRSPAARSGCGRGPRCCCR